MHRIRLQTIVAILACLAAFCGWTALHQRNRPPFSSDPGYASVHRQWEAERDAALLLSVGAMVVAMMVGRRRLRGLG